MAYAMSNTICYVMYQTSCHIPDNKPTVPDVGSISIQCLRHRVDIKSMLETVSLLSGMSYYVAYVIPYVTSYVMSYFMSYVIFHVICYGMWHRLCDIMSCHITNVMSFVMPHVCIRWHICHVICNATCHVKLHMWCHVSWHKSCQIPYVMSCIRRHVISQIACRLFPTLVWYRYDVADIWSISNRCRVQSACYLGCHIMWHMWFHMQRHMSCHVSYFMSYVMACVMWYHVMACDIMSCYQHFFCRYTIKWQFQFNSPLTRQGVFWQINVITPMP